LGPSLIRLTGQVILFIKKAAGRLLAHIRSNSVLWISLAAFVVLAWLATGTSCVIHSITGFPCPGCGLTRGLLASLHGDFAAAWHWHPLFWLAPLILLAVLLLLAFRPALLHSRCAGRIWMALAILFILVYIVRMILYYPETEPMTYNWHSVFGRIWTLIRMILIFKT